VGRGPHTAVSSSPIENPAEIEIPFRAPDHGFDQERKNLSTHAENRIIDNSLHDRISHDRISHDRISHDLISSGLFQRREP
jgi:hypothetical protein